MQLYVEFSLLTSRAGPSGSAYALLSQAGHRPRIEYVPERDRSDRLQRVTGHREPPVLVTDSGEVVAGYGEIAAWLARAA
jgi:hypothetical protein